MSRVMKFLIGAVLLATFGVDAAGQDRRREAASSADTAAVPKDILGFAHVRVADLLGTPAGKAAWPKIAKNMQEDPLKSLGRRHRRG